MSTGTSWWDVEYTTSSTLKKYRDLINPNPAKGTTCLSVLATQWREVGKKISSLEDLISCYFSAFKIICIPAAKLYPPSLIKGQYQMLQSAIDQGSTLSWERRKSLGLLMSATELEYYLESAFDHFSKNPKAPFNFLSAALSHKPVASTLEDNICEITVYFMSCHPTADGAEIFNKVAPFVASCIFLNTHRCRYPRRRK